MIILWDNVLTTPNLIWDDSTEELTGFRLATDDIQKGYPFSVIKTTYEHIQYMEVFLPPKDATDWVANNLTDTISKSTAMSLIGQVSACQSYVSRLKDQRIPRD